MERFDNEGYSPILLAVKIGNLNILKLLIDHGADINANCNVVDATPLLLVRLLSMSSQQVFMLSYILGCILWSFESCRVID
jgi:hypothetical protein